MSFIVAVDGYTGVGKGTLANLLAKKYKLMNIDTGAIYRCLTLDFIEKNIKDDDIELIKKELNEVDIKFDDGKSFLNGRDVSKEIREAPVNNRVSQVSHIPIVREAMIRLQRRMAEGRDVILDGRDIGTKVFPNADVKIFMNASLDARVNRRFKQNQQKGIESTWEEVKENIASRDLNDTTSDVSPLVQAEDAYYLDTTNMNINKMVKAASKVIDKKKKEIKIFEKAYNDKELKFYTKFLKLIYDPILKTLYWLVYRPKFINVKQFNELEGPVILCGNHVHAMDAIGLELFSKRKIRFITKRDLWLKNGILRSFGYVYRNIPVHREGNDVNSIKICLKALKNKETLGIFPEGTRHGMDKHEKPKNGAIFLANKTNAKIVPVGIIGDFKPFKKIKYNIGQPMDLEQYDKKDSEWLTQATEDLMKQIVSLTKEEK